MSELIKGLHMKNTAEFRKAINVKLFLSKIQFQCVYIVVWHLTVSQADIWSKLSLLTHT